MREQLLRLLETEGLTPAKFADKIGVQRSSISHILSGRNKPSYDFMVKIMESFPEINAEWIITGKGEMFKVLDKKELKNTGKNDLFSEPIIDEDSTKEKKISEMKGIKDTEQPKEELNFQNKEFTNVNKIESIFVLYKDGTFKNYKERE